MTSDMKSHKIYPSSSWQLPPTPRQSTAIARLELALGIKDNSNPANRWEARRLIYNLIHQVKLKEASSASKE